VTSNQLGRSIQTARTRPIAQPQEVASNEPGVGAMPFGATLGKTAEKPHPSMRQHGRGQGEGLFSAYMQIKNLSGKGWEMRKWAEKAETRALCHLSSHLSPLRPAPSRLQHQILHTAPSPLGSAHRRPLRYMSLLFKSVPHPSTVSFCDNWILNSDRFFMHFALGPLSADPNSRHISPVNPTSSNVIAIRKDFAPLRDKRNSLWGTVSGGLGKPIDVVVNYNLCFIFSRSSSCSHYPLSLANANPLSRSLSHLIMD